MRTVHFNDIGTMFEVTVRDQDGSEVPELTDATALKMIFKRPSGNVFERDAQFVEPSAIAYTTADGDLNEVGKWKAQCYIEIDSYKGRTSIFEFMVAPVL